MTPGSAAQLPRVEPRTSARSEGGSGQDLVVVAVILLASLILYAGQLGFYSDDWDFLRTWGPHTQSLGTLLRHYYDQEDVLVLRPTRTVYLTALYRVFGNHPLGFHVVDNVLMVGTMLLLYLTVRKYGLGRLAAVAITLVFGLMPQYSSDRYWVNAASLSYPCMAFCFLSFYCAASVVTTSPRRRWLWVAATVLSAVVSIFAYEVSTPMLGLIPVLMYLGYRSRSRSQTDSAPKRRTVGTAALVILAAIALSVVVKLAFQIRTKFQGRFLHHLGPVVDSAASRFVDFNVGRFGLMSPVNAWRALGERFDPRIVAATLLTGAAMALYCARLARRGDGEPPSRRQSAGLMLVGLACYWLGFAPFAADVGLAFGTTGPENRITIAAASGTALWLVGLFGWLSSLLPGRLLRATAFAALTVTYATSGFAIVNTRALYWVEAGQRQERLLSDMRTALPTVPPGTTLLVGGVCQFAGPGIVFETEYDMTGAVQSVYGDSTLRANVLNPRMLAGPDSLTLPFYDSVPSYAYGDRLLLFDAARHEAIPLAAPAVARERLAAAARDLSACRGIEGKGAPVF